MVDSSRVVLVTGAASGIGRHLTGAFARRGDRVVATDVDDGALGRVAREDAWSLDRVQLARLDVRSETEFQKALDIGCRVYGRVDVLLNVAGYLRPARIWESTTTDVDRHFDVNVKGTVHGMRVVGSYFVRERRGHIVNFGSLASLAPVPGLTLYSASKFAVRGLSLAAAHELSPHGVAVTLVMPDAVDTPMLDLQVDYPEAAMTFSGSHPLTVHDIERAIFDEVLRKRPLEITIPRSRGLVARAADVAPGLVRKLGPWLEAKGRRAQTRAKQRRT